MFSLLSLSDFCSGGRHTLSVNVQRVRSERSADLCAWKLHRKVTLDKEVPGVLGLPLLGKQDEERVIFS